MYYFCKVCLDCDKKFINHHCGCEKTSIVTLVCTKKEHDKILEDEDFKERVEKIRKRTQPNSRKMEDDLKNEK